MAEIVQTNMSSMSELFELLDRLQSSRLDDQRCEMPSLSRKSAPGPHHNHQPLVERLNPSRSRLEQVLSLPSPHPQVVVEGSSYWVDPSDQARTIIKRTGTQEIKCLVSSYMLFDQSLQISNAYGTHNLKYVFMFKFHK